MKVLIIGDISNDVLEPKSIYNLDNPENSDMDAAKGYVVDNWDAYVVGDAIHIPSQYNIKSGEIIFKKGAVTPEPEPTSIEQSIQSLKQAQQDTDTAALDLDYRLTLLENGVKVGEI